MKSYSIKQNVTTEQKIAQRRVLTLLYPLDPSLAWPTDCWQTVTTTMTRNRWAPSAQHTRPTDPANRSTTPSRRHCCRGSRSPCSATSEIPALRAAPVVFVRSARYVPPATAHRLLDGVPCVKPSLVLANVHFVTEPSIPTSIASVDAGGLHFKSPEPLPVVTT